MNGASAWNICCIIVIIFLLCVEVNGRNMLFFIRWKLRGVIALLENWFVLSCIGDKPRTVRLSSGRTNSLETLSSNYMNGQWPKDGAAVYTPTTCNKGTQVRGFLHGFIQFVTSWFCNPTILGVPCSSWLSFWLCTLFVFIMYIS